MSRTIDDVLSVAGNRPVFETLVSILKAGKAIAFVGAGASAPMYPLWGKFIELLAEHAVDEGKAEEKDAKRWLQVLLGHLAERRSPAGRPFAAPPSRRQQRPRLDLPAKWVHETSNDEKFTGRDDEIAPLHRWVRDAAVRALGVSAVGGTGKTALIGHWLKENSRLAEPPVCRAVRVELLSEPRCR